MECFSVISAFVGLVINVLSAPPRRPVKVVVQQSKITFKNYHFVVDKEITSLTTVEDHIRNIKVMPFHQPIVSLLRN